MLIYMNHSQNLLKFMYFMNYYILRNDCVSFDDSLFCLFHKIIIEGQRISLVIIFVENNKKINSNSSGFYV